MDPSDLSQMQLKRFGISLTGGIGTGKSTVGRLLRQQGFTVIDADQLARRVTAPGTAGLAAMTSRFGPDILNADGTLNRARLGQLVFSQPELRRELEQLTHPLIRAELYAEVAALDLEHRPRWFFYEAALIFESGSAGDLAQHWATYCSPSVQLERVMQRDGLSLERAKAIIASQMPANDKARLADVVINTDGPLASVAAQVDTLIQGLRFS